ncbi:Peptide methionine sulfoxide reductase MsrA 3 [compost metagenome]
MAKTDTAVLAGGCFWGMEDLLRKQPGITKAEVGYAGGTTKNATYNIVKTGVTNHAESVRLTFDTEKTSYEKILMYFFKIHDPTTENRQGNDVGTQYRSLILYNSPEQKKIAEDIIARVNKSGAWKKPVVTQVQPLGEFYLAEDYHQDYLQKNPGGYTCHYERKIDFGK